MRTFASFERLPQVIIWTILFAGQTGENKPKSDMKITKKEYVRPESEITTKVEAEFNFMSGEFGTNEGDYVEDGDEVEIPFD